MFDFIRTYQLDIMLALFAACISFAILLLFTQFLERSRKIILIFMELIAAFLLFFDRMAYVYSGDVSRTGFIMVRVSNFCVFFLTSGIVFAFNLYLINLIREGKKNTSVPIILNIVSAGAVFGMLLSIISQFTNLYYYFDEHNKYHRGRGFLIAYLIPVICPIIQYIVIRKYKRSFSKLIYTSIVLYIFVPIIMGIIQIFQYGVSIVNMAMTLVSISLYIFTYLDINRTVKHAHQIEMNELKEDEKRMKRLFNHTANAFVKSIEERDEYSKGYFSKVASLSKRIAQNAGKDDEKCDEVYYAALLHDVCSGDILSEIEEYPYLKEGALYSHEHYDGTGTPKGLKGKDIPEIARIISIADAYVSMTTDRKDHVALPYITVREKIVELSGSIFDPDFAKIMLKIMDAEYVSNSEKQPIESELYCGDYKDKVSLGVEVKNIITNITFSCVEMQHNENEYSTPVLLVFDSYDRHYHGRTQAMEAFKYTEYAEVWPDGHYILTGARNMEVVTEKKSDNNVHVTGLYDIKTSKYDDHVRIEINNDSYRILVTIALYDNSKSVYVGITGEHCHIFDIVSNETGILVNDGDIPRIAPSINFIDRLESDIPNIQIDKNRSAFTDGIKIADELRIYFHSISLPSANLIWHCPYIILFYSEDGKVGGKGYKEYALIKINGEISGDESLSKNSFTMKKKDNFEGWDKWKAAAKEGIDCSILFLRRGNKISTITENLGIAIDNTTIVKDGPKEVYVSITGDEVAITDIRIMR